MGDIAKRSGFFAALGLLCAALGVSSVANAQTTTTTTVTTTTSTSVDGRRDPASANLAPIETSPAPPPPLPAYEQPPVPAPGYMWTPGYWARNGWGFYWVPGAWVLAPYPGALWTPGYWGFVNNVYRWNTGYWGPHIGFYGGVNYGFGYIGVGYVGGYWDRGVFRYNRAVTHVDVTRVTNVYVRNVDVHMDNRRVSYNGGQGGLPSRPDPHELAAAHERHTPPMRVQMDRMRESGHQPNLHQVQQEHTHESPVVGRELSAREPAREPGRGVERGGFERGGDRAERREPGRPARGGGER